MRVMCIDADFQNAFHRLTWKYVRETPQEGETYHVKEILEICGNIGYVLDEIDSGINPITNVPISWNSKRFILLEDEEYEQKEEYIYQEQSELICME